MPRHNIRIVARAVEVLPRFEACASQPPILKLPQYGKPYSIDVDASKGQLGCVQLKNQKACEILACWIWSRTLNQAARNYSAKEREGLGVVWSIVFLRHYLKTSRFTVSTDHQALKKALFLPNAERRVAKPRFRLAEFDFDVVNRPGVNILFLMP